MESQNTIHTNGQKEILNPILPAELIKENIAQVQKRIADAAQQAHRDPSEIKLMLATKYQPIENILSAINAGVTLFGQNLIHHLSTTEPEISQYPHKTTVIGHTQANKLSTAMEYASRIDTVDSLKMAQRIARRQSSRIDLGKATGAYPILLQVNSADAKSQFGCNPADFIDIAKKILEIPEVKIEGIMTIGANSADLTAVSRSFQITQSLSKQLRTLPGLSKAKEISMGMTSDLEVAVAHGSTIVRVGTAVFGQRKQS